MTSREGLSPRFLRRSRARGASSDCGKLSTRYRSLACATCISLELDEGQRLLVERGRHLTPARIVHEDLAELLHRLSARASRALLSACPAEAAARPMLK